MELRNFYSGLIHLNEFYGISMTEDQYENIGLHAWDHIGNKIVRTHLHHAVIRDYKVELPCNVDIIEAVLTRGEAYVRTDGIDDWTQGNYNREVENWIERWKGDSSPDYTPGRLISYEEVGDTLHFKLTDIPISILYKGVQLDDKGLPMLNFKEVDAIAKYCAWIYNQKQAMVTRDKATFEMAQMMMQQWQVACDNARTPIYLNQNDMDELLNTLSTWDRKRYGINFKPLR